MKIKLRLPRWFLSWVGMSLTATVGILFYMSGLWAYFGVSPSPSPVIWPDPGAYISPSQEGVANSDQSQTLRLNLNGQRMVNILFWNMNIGAPGITDAIQITRTSDGSGGTLPSTSTVRLVCEKVIFREVSAPTFRLSNSEIYTLNATSSVLVSGSSATTTFDMSIGDIAVESTRGAGSYKADGKVVDRIIIDIGSSDATCKKLEFYNVKTSVGGINLDFLEVGTMDLQTLRIGTGDISDPDFFIDPTVKTAFFNDNIVDDAGVSIK